MFIPALFSQVWTNQYLYWCGGIAGGLGAAISVRAFHSMGLIGDPSTAKSLGIFKDCGNGYGSDEDENEGEEGLLQPEKQPKGQNGFESLKQ